MMMRVPLHRAHCYCGWWSSWTRRRPSTFVQEHLFDAQLLLSSERFSTTTYARRYIVSSTRPSLQAALGLDYTIRAAAFNIADPNDILKALKDPNTIILDVRTEDEIAKDGSFVAASAAAQWKKSNCTADACPELSESPERFVPDKDQTVVVYCRVGRRALRAKTVLESQGYTNVLNGGGLGDMLEYPNL